MYQSKLFTKTLKSPPKDAVSINHQLLRRAGFIKQLTSGIWSFLPLGWRVYKKLEKIVEKELDAIGSQEVFLPTLIPAELWRETGRWDTMDPPLFKCKDRHEKWFGLGSTHEEVITELSRFYINSYRDLPQALYQIQNKFRNETRPSGGLLRTKEFLMKDLYSFHQSEEDLRKFYQKVVKAYQKFFKVCKLETVLVEAHSGSIGGNKSQEFMVFSETGEDKILYCPRCGWGTNIEKAPDEEKCPKCFSKLEKKNAIEIGHVFELGALYSEKMSAFFVDQKGKRKPLIMGCYGIGLPRLLATIVEVHHDQDGIIWPLRVAPFEYHLLSFKKDKEANRIYRLLTSYGKEVLFDERDLSPGEKLKDADLIGIPKRLIISQKTGKMIEYKERGNKKTKLIKIKDLMKFFNINF